MRKFRAGWIVCASALLLASACAKGPPRNPENACDIFGQHRGWWKAARESREKWGVPEGTQLAFVHQESRFRHDSRPPRRRLLWIFPWKRTSSAYGYGQVTDGTWSDYQRRTGRRRADRDDFEDVADFIGWYGDVIERITGIPKTDPYRLYLAYHEGPAGYKRGTHRKKPWLDRVARKVAARAARYEQQYGGCRESLGRKRFWLF